MSSTAGAARGASASEPDAPVSDRNPPSRRLVWSALAIVYVGWGSTYVALRIMAKVIPPVLGASLRYLLAGLIMYGALAAHERRLPRLTLRQLGVVTVLALLLLVGGNGLITLAERHVPAGTAALLVASVPLWLVLLRFLTGDRPSRRVLAGLLLGFMGVALLVVHGVSNIGAGPILLVVLAAFLWALGSFFSSRSSLRATATVTAYEMLIGGVLLAATGAAFGEHWGAVVDKMTVGALLALIYLALIGSIVAFTAYLWLLDHAPLSQVSTYAYANPVVAVALGALMLGEQVTWVTVLGGAVTVAAVAIVVGGDAGRRPSATAAEELPGGGP